jgi:acetylornithine/succinyldiaminopimelate/putrescine aminotransferase
MNQKDFQESIEEKSHLFEELGKELVSKNKDVLSRSSFKGMVGAFLFYDENENFPLIEKANEFVDACLANGLLVIRTGRESVKIAPPLSMSPEDISYAFKIFDKAIAGIFKR